MYLQIGSRLRAVILSLGGICCATYASAQAQLSIDIALPSEAIGLHIRHYPNLVPVPRYPVYYARDLDSNLFFSEGHYWVYVQDNWYTSDWYNGPWEFVPPEIVPDSILRVPLLYYRQPPPYFAGWDRQAPPHWGEHWGRGWEDRRHGWNHHWDLDEVPRRVPPPDYRRHDLLENYSRVDDQRQARKRNSFYEPREDWERHRPDWLHGNPSATRAPDAGDANRDLQRHPVPRHGDPQLPQAQAHPRPAQTSLSQSTAPAEKSPERKTP